MFARLVAVLALGAAACGTVVAQSSPDGSLNEAHPLVLCSTLSCTRVDHNQTLQQRRGTCPEGSECVASASACDGGTCVGACFDGGTLGATCDSKGCCTFSCGGIVGFQCPEAMRCLASTECCDRPGACTKEGRAAP